MQRLMQLHYLPSSFASHHSLVPRGHPFAVLNCAVPADNGNHPDCLGTKRKTSWHWKILLPSPRAVFLPAATRPLNPTRLRCSLPWGLGYLFPWISCPLQVHLNRRFSASSVVYRAREVAVGQGRLTTPERCQAESAGGDLNKWQSQTLVLFIDATMTRA